MKIQKQLFALRDEKYAQFQSRLIPTMPRELIIGVRIPELRKIAKPYFKSSECEVFLKKLPHRYYDENMLHGLLVSEIKDYEECIQAVDAFLPFVDNWAVCDTMSPKIFKKHKPELIKKIKEWAASDKTYTCRFGLEMLMTHFLDGDFKEHYFQIAANIHSEEYYVNMMIAWFFATALAKQWDSAIKYIENQKLDPRAHNKAIQKARESFRITDKQKEYLKTLTIATVKTEKPKKISTS